MRTCVIHAFSCCQPLLRVRRVLERLCDMAPNKPGVVPNKEPNMSSVVGDAA